MHYFSPVEKMPLLEVIVTEQHGRLGHRHRRRVREAPGQDGDRGERRHRLLHAGIIAPYSNEALRLLEEGATIEAIDKAMERWGIPVGPLLLADEVGLDVGQKVSKIMVDAFGDRMAGPR